MTISLSQTDIGSAQITNGTSTVTVASRAIGAAASDRLVFLAFSSFDNSGVVLADPSSITIGGVTATKHVVGKLDGTFTPASYVYSALVPSGTTASVVVNLPSNAGTNYFIGFTVYRIVGADTTTPVVATASTATQSTTQAVSTSITVPANGALIASAAGLSASTLGVSWVNATQDTDFFGVLSSDLYTAASRLTAGTNAITVNSANGTVFNMEIAVVAIQQASITSTPLTTANIAFI